ncbi:hypothetical protein LTR94_033247, partial [Friedmanniomyces endolithicus]
DGRSGRHLQQARRSAVRRRGDCRPAPRRGRRRPRRHRLPDRGRPPAVSEGPGRNPAAGEVGRRRQRQRRPRRRRRGREPEGRDPPDRPSRRRGVRTLRQCRRTGADGGAGVHHRRYGRSLGRLQRARGPVPRPEDRRRRARRRARAG